MVHTYTLSFQDVLTYNLYNHSLKKKNKAIKITRVIVSFNLLVTGAALLLVENYAAGIPLLILGAAYPFLIRMYTKWAYKRAFTKAVLTDLKGTIDSPISFQLTAEHIVTADHGGTTTYNLTSIESVIEIGGYFFIKMNNSHVIIVPKTDDSFIATIRQMIEDRQLHPLVNLTWKY